MKRFARNFIYLRNPPTPLKPMGPTIQTTWHEQYNEWYHENETHKHLEYMNLGLACMCGGAVFYIGWSENDHIPKEIRAVTALFASSVACIVASFNIPVALFTVYTLSTKQQSIRNFIHLHDTSNGFESNNSTFSFSFGTSKEIGKKD